MPTWQDAVEPEPVIWHENGGSKPFVTPGRPAILSGEGGIGKSWLSLQLALAACRGTETPAECLGFHVRQGPVVLLA